MAANCKYNNSFQLKQFVETVILEGGEGVVLRQPKSFYQAGLSDSLLKIKAERDQEGLVVDIQDETHVLMLPNGTTITVDHSVSNDEEEEASEQEEVNIGDIVTFAFSHYDGDGVPIRPKWRRKREDVNWLDVMKNYYSSVPLKKSVNELTRRFLYTAPLQRMPAGHWTVGESSNIREYFEQLAKKRNRDPLDPETWYTFSREELDSQGLGIISHYNGSWIKAVMNIFPNIGLQEGEFPRVPNNHWDSELNRKAFFDKFAKKKGFDPLIADNWYEISRSAVEEEKGSYLLQRGGLPQNIMNAYPNIGVDKSKFKYQAQWQEKSTRRKFFDNYAKRKGFDPLVAENWYSVTTEDIHAETSGRSIITAFYNNSVKRAILDLYPEVTFKMDKMFPRKFFREPANRRTAFDSFANQKGFDPLIAENWYPYTGSILASTTKLGNIIQTYYKNTLSRALKALYPDVNFDFSKFPIAAKGYLHDINNQRKVFVNLAKAKGFDPLNPENWSTVGKDDVKKVKGGIRILALHSGSLRAVLASIFPELAWDTVKAEKLTRNHWQSAAHVKQFFDEFAKKQSFDPQIPENWYKYSALDIRKTEKGSYVLQHYGRSFIKALQVAYPTIKFDEKEFCPSKIWTDYASKRKQFMEQFAEKMNFNPLVPSNWHPISKKDILQETKGKAILGYYGGSLQLLVEDVFGINVRA